MTPPSLSVVGPLRPEAKPETVAQRVRRLQAEARQLARDHVRALILAMGEAATVAEEIRDGGDAYPAGIRDLARVFVDDAEARLNNLESLLGKSA